MFPPFGVAIFSASAPSAYSFYGICNEQCHNHRCQHKANQDIEAEGDHWVPGLVITGVFGEQEIPRGEPAQNQAEKHPNENLVQFTSAQTGAKLAVKSSGVGLEHGGIMPCTAAACKHNVESFFALRRSLYAGQ